MKIRFICFFVFIFSVQSAFAQFGIRAKYNSNTFSDWEQFVPNINEPNFEVGLDYWFRLKNKRIEFTPELYYGFGKVITYGSEIKDLISTNQSYFGLQFNTSIYLFDLTGDCDCPTFSKQGPSFGKGFFINLAPGITYYQHDWKFDIIDAEQSNSKNIKFRAGLGLGYDIGINNLLTITPMFHYILSSTNIIGVRIDGNTIENSPWSSLQFGLRVGFRPDYVKQYGRR